MQKDLLHIIPTLNSGGAERLLFDLVSGTSKADFRHTVCVLRDKGNLGSDIENGGSRLIQLSLGTKRPWLVASKKISKLISEVEPDLLVTWLLDASIATRIARFPRKQPPILTTLHSTDYDATTIAAGGWPVKKMMVLKAIDRITSHLADPYFVACSSEVAASYKRHLRVKDDRMSVIHNFTNESVLKNQMRAREQMRNDLGIPRDAMVYLNVGRLDPQKGQMLLLEAFDSTQKKIKNAILVIVGEGIMRNSLESEIRSKRLEDKVFLIGSRSDIGSLLNSADIFVFPSLIEGFGIALVEAMMMGLPSITFNLPVFGEIVSDGVTGVMVDEMSTSALADQMIKMAKDPSARLKLGERARQHAVANFGSQVVIPKWENLFQQLSS